MIVMKVKKLHKDAVIPFYAKAGDSGFDLVSVENVVVPAHSSAKVPLGLAFELPENYEIQVRNRSGVTSKTKLRVQFGTVDNGYRGEVSVMVDNIGDEDIVVEKGFRIAQGVVQYVPNVRIVEADELSDTDRGSGGFGSTGVKVKDVTTKEQKAKGIKEYIEIPEDSDGK